MEGQAVRMHARHREVAVPSTSADPLAGDRVRRDPLDVPREAAIHEAVIAAYKPPLREWASIEGRGSRRARADELGAVEALSKSFELDYVIAAVGRWIRSGSSGIE